MLPNLNYTLAQLPVKPHSSPLLRWEKSVLTDNSVRSYGQSCSSPRFSLSYSRLEILKYICFSACLFVTLQLSTSVRPVRDASGEGGMK